MLTVIFGAGASYDSAPSYHPKSFPEDIQAKRDRPPLANELFDGRQQFADTMARFPECLPIIPLLRHRDANIPVERVLEGLQKEAETYPEGKQQLAAIRYYLHVMIWQCEDRWQQTHKGVTNYKTLLDRINRRRIAPERVCLVTFNYDRMLEDALSGIGVEIDTLGDYVNNSKNYQLIKLHGSVDWGRRVAATPHLRDLLKLPDDQIPHEVIQTSPFLQVTKDYMKSKKVPMAKSENAVLFPALAIPVETKGDFECPNDQLTALENCIPKTTKLLVIGWRATDAPFLELLTERLPRRFSGMVVAGDRKQADEVVERMQEAGVKGSGFRRGKSGFTEFILDGEADDFLRS